MKVMFSYWCGWNRFFAFAYGLCEKVLKVTIFNLHVYFRHNLNSLGDFFLKRLNSYWSFWYNYSKTTSFDRYNVIVFFLNFGGQVLSMRPLIPLFWTSGDVSSGFQSQSRQPYSHLAEAYPKLKFFIWRIAENPLGTLLRGNRHRCRFSSFGVSCL